MTPANEPNDRELHRIIRSLDRRVNRLEDTQITDRELGAGFDRLYTEIDGLALEVRELRTEVGNIKSEVSELNRKFDIVMAHITGNS